MMYSQYSEFGCPDVYSGKRYLMLKTPAPKPAASSLVRAFLLMPTSYLMESMESKRIQRVFVSMSLNLQLKRLPTSTVM